MAYSSVRVQFEIGHEASVRTKKTPEGFTHDWEVFVRGADNTDIQYFVDKIVFHLHETFPKPRRVIKDPPYLVKESGYAGFVLPIDVYLKNKEEPKKISFQYDLTLQPSGPPISRVLREPRLFQNPSEDFRRKLIRGGGVGVDTPSEIHPEDFKPLGSSQNKTKLSETPVKKTKPEPGTNHSFAELFGTPIRRIQDPKKVSEPSKKTSEADACKEKKKIVKVGPFKEEKEKFFVKEKSKEQDKSKEKSQKRLSTPPLSINQTLKPKDESKACEEKEKRKEDQEDKKKRKDDKDKKDKAKDLKEIDKKEKKGSAEVDHLKKANPVKSQDVRSFACSEKQNNECLDKESLEKEKHRHRHKKKEKEKNRDKEKTRKDKEKGEKDSREKDKEKEKKNKKKQEEEKQKEEKPRKKSPTPALAKAKKGPLNALLDELGSSDSASPLSEEDSVPTFKSPSKANVKSVPETKPQSLGVCLGVDSKLKIQQSAILNSSEEGKADKEMEIIFKADCITEAKNKKETSSSKKNKKSEKDAQKEKTKEEQRVRLRSTDGEEEGEQKDKATKEENEKCSFQEKKLKPSHDKETEFADASEEPRRPDKFTKEYVAQLRDLQHRIMSLEDNTELQKVVKVIAETGQYEITKKTFDFDLCALDSDTIKRLQQFFGPT